MLFRSLVLVISLALPLAAHADHHILYECVDAAGAKQFTNVPPKNKAACKVLSVGTLNPVPAAPGAAGAARHGSKAAASPSPANFPKVDRETQQTRDSQRRRILDQELANEQKLLDQSKKDLTEQESVRLGTERNYQKVLDRLEPYQKKVKQHEDNIASLKREVANLR